MDELVIVAAENESSLKDEIARLVAFLDRVPDVPLLDVAYTASLKTGPCVLSLVVSDIADLRARLDAARTRLDSESLRRIRDKSGTYYCRNRLLGEGGAKMAFVYPGVMGFYPDMLRDLVIENDVCRHAFDELEEAMKENDDFTPSSFVFPPAPYYRHDADIYASGAYAQTLVSTYAACDALTRLLRLYGVSPDGTVGLAGGDLAAFMCSGAAGEHPARADRVGVLREIYQIVDKAVNRGGLEKVVMLTVLLHAPEENEKVLSAFGDRKAWCVVDLSPRQKTYAILAEDEEAVLASLAAAHVHVMKLALDRPFNTPLCESLVPVVRKFAATWMKHDLSTEVYSCATATRLASGLKAAREDAASRWAMSVRFRETIRQMYDEGYRVFLEVGPRGYLTSAIDETLKGENVAALALNSIHRSGRVQFLHALGQLLALGAKVDLAPAFTHRGARTLDFGAALSLEVRKDAEMILSRAFPRLTLVSHETALQAADFLTEPKKRGAKVAARRAAVLAQQARRQRQFDFGAMNPLVSDADTLSQTPGVAIEISKLVKISDMPFIADFALGTSQISYSDPNLKGLILLPVPVALEMMAETAALVVPSRTPVRVEDFFCRHMVSFRDEQLKLVLRAERVAAATAGEIAVKVQLREDSPKSAYTWPLVETVVIFAAEAPAPEPVSVAPLSRPRSVHWSGREIYPSRLSSGARLRRIRFVEAWSESGLDYQIEVPALAGNVAFTRFPIWIVNPVLLGVVVSGFALWRSHERFAGAFSLPFRMRRLTLPAVLPEEGASLKCYLRLTSVTPESQLCDITVTDGNGKQLSVVSGWEELTERVPVEYCQLVMQPPLAFLTRPLASEQLGSPATDVASAFVTDIPYSIFTRDNEELWLRIISRIVLCGRERKAFREMSGSIPRRAEWLFGRIAAKEAVRRFLNDFYQARWSDADVEIDRSPRGKPIASGTWRTFLTTKLDIAIAHTAQFVVAVAAASARVGVDVEAASRVLSDDFAKNVFSAEEHELGAETANPAQTFLRFWCAKEAVSKALGTGIAYDPDQMNVVDYVQDAGRLVMRLTGKWLDEFPTFKGRDIEVTVRTVRDHALATCFIPMSLFNEE